MSTYTFAIMEVSKETYEEIKRKMIEAGYDHAFVDMSDGPIIDMHGIGIQAKPEQKPPQLTAADINTRSPRKERKYKR